MKYWPREWRQGKGAILLNSWLKSTGFCDFHQQFEGKPLLVFGRHYQQHAGYIKTIELISQETP
jgi:hypothetical protein